MRELPAPFREIAIWKFLDGWARPEIVRRLRLWRPVGRSAALRLLSQTHAMLRCLRDGERPRDRHPRRYDPRFNPWLARPRRR